MSVIPIETGGMKRREIEIVRKCTVWVDNGGQRIILQTRRRCESSMEMQINWNAEHDRVPACWHVWRHIQRNIEVDVGRDGIGYSQDESVARADNE